MATPAITKAPVPGVLLSDTITIATTAAMTGTSSPILNRPSTEDLPRVLKKQKPTGPAKPTPSDASENPDSSCAGERPSTNSVPGVFPQSQDSDEGLWLVMVGRRESRLQSWPCLQEPYRRWRWSN